MTEQLAVNFNMIQIKMGVAWWACFFCHYVSRVSHGAFQTVFLHGVGYSPFIIYS